MKCYTLIAWLLVLTMDTQLNATENETAFVGDWLLQLDTGHGNIEVGLNVEVEEEKLVATIVNGPEKIALPATGDGDCIQIPIPHYDSELELKLVSQERLEGVWRKVRGLDKVAVMAATADRPEKRIAENTGAFLGRWSVQFADSADLAVAAFERFDDDGGSAVLGTFLTTTGDYRFLSGFVDGGTLYLSCFDGGHAFLFTMVRDGDSKLKGKFYSGNWYEDSFTATRDADAKLPDAFLETKVVGNEKLEQLSFPNLDGKIQSLKSDELMGKVTLIEVFGSWCPNCHDEAAYLAELRERYGERGLKVVGLAFELTGDFERDARQVQRYVDRFEVDYPILIAGTSDKALATEKFPVLDRIRSYPTTLFLDESGVIRATYTGFSGPATGQANKTLRSRFEALIEKLLDE
ncbi:MAG: TlpA disulfide reductase family protein [Planctomycetota bacterium]